MMSRIVKSMSSARPSQITIDAWEAVLRAHAALLPRIGRDLEARTGMPLTWYDVLLNLYRAPEHRLRMQALSDTVVLSRSRVSRIVDELVEAGHVQRLPDPEDGRATLAALTDQGTRAFRAAAPVHLEALECYIGALTADEAATICRALTALVSAVE